MSIEAQIVGTLQSLAPVYPLMAPQGAVLPRITYFRVAGTQEETLADGGSAPRLRFQVDIWDASFKDARAMAESAKAALRAALIVGEMTDNPDAYEQETKIYHVS